MGSCCSICEDTSVNTRKISPENVVTAIEIYPIPKTTTVLQNFEEMNKYTREYEITRKDLKEKIQTGDNFQKVGEYETQIYNNHIDDGVYRNGSKEKKYVRGTLNCNWSLIDDQRKLYGSFIISYSETHFIDEIQLLMVEYLGCLACQNEASYLYRSVSLMHSKCFKPIRCDGVYEFTFNHAICQLTGETTEPYLNCTFKLIEKLNLSRNVKLNCRYCGLSILHHVGNRERIYNRSNFLYDENEKLFDPQMFYPEKEMRCPLHMCIGCNNPFVKIEKTHLCAPCIYKEKEMIKKKKGVKWHSNLEVNNYTDELIQYFIHNGNKYPKIHVPRTELIFSKSGRHESTYNVERIHRKKAEEQILNYLQSVGHVCIVCKNKFRLPIVLPALKNDMDLQSTVCGFCVFH